MKHAVVQTATHAFIYMSHSMHKPYSGKIVRALYLANQSNEIIIFGSLNFGDDLPAGLASRLGSCTCIRIGTDTHAQPRKYWQVLKLVTLTQIRQPPKLIPRQIFPLYGRSYTVPLYTHEKAYCTVSLLQVFYLMNLNKQLLLLAIYILVKTYAPAVWP